jgi:hypothetical protein
VPDYCLECFQDDLCVGQDNYFRHEWAIASVSHCHVHKTLLRSACVFCNEMLCPVMKFSGGRVQIYCNACFEAMRKPEYIWQSRKSDIYEEIIDFETEVFRSLRSRKPRRKIPFEIVDDIAFLYFCADLPKSTAACKRSLFGWENAVRSSVLTTALRESWVFDGAHLNPLATVEAVYRHELIEVSIAVYEGFVRNVWFRGRKGVHRPALLEDLFEILDDAGKEELVARANGWPKYLRDQVRAIVNTPRSTSSYARYYLRQGWLTSDARLAVNRGKIPEYSHF